MQITEHRRSVGGHERRRARPPADVHHMGTAGAEAAARGRVGRGRDLALEDDSVTQRVGAWGSASGSRRAAPAVYGCFGAAVDVVGRTLLDDAARGTSPRSRSLTWRTTARSCAMKRNATPSSRWSSSSRLITWPASTRRATLTGSSSTTSFGSMRERPRNRRPAGADRPESSRGYRSRCSCVSPRVDSSSATRRCGRLGSGSRWARSGSATLSATSPAGRTTSTGPGTRAASAAQLVGSCARQLGDVGRPRRRPARRRASSSRSSEPTERRLPDPDSPTRPRSRPRDREIDAVDRVRRGRARARRTPARSGKCFVDRPARSERVDGASTGRTAVSVSSSDRMHRHGGARPRSRQRDRRARVHSSIAYATTRGEAAAGRHRRGHRHLRRGSTSRRSSRLGDLRHRAEQPFGVRVLRRARTARSTVAFSTIWPAYITATRSQMSATTPRSWVTNRIAMPSSCWSRLSRSRIWAWIVTSSAVVGSSAMRSVGSHEQRHRDHHPLAHPTRELVRVLPRSALRRRGSRRGRAARRARPAPAAATRLCVEPHRLDELVPDGERGVEARHRVLEHHGDLVAAHLAHVVERQVEQIAAFEHHRARHDPPRRRRHEPHDRQRRHGLAGSALADDADRLAGTHVEAQLCRPPSPAPIR